MCKDEVRLTTELSLLLAYNQGKITVEEYERGVNEYYKSIEEKYPELFGNMWQESM